MKKFIAILVVACSVDASGQSAFRRHFPGTEATLQFAGSTGFMSAGYFVVTPKQCVELGLMYGYTPQTLGGPLNSLTLKFIYDPFHIGIGRKLMFEPVQLGGFVTLWLGENIDLAWSARYPKQYYWWQSSVRKHLFASTQLSWMFRRRVDRLALYFEVNTNDLYIVSYYPNRESQSLYDIFFFGIGTRLYLAPRQASGNTQAK